MIEHIAIALGLGLTVWFTTHGRIGAISWTSTRALFVIVTIAASLCVVAALFVLARSWASNAAEGGLLGGGLFVMSILPLVHGLTAPNVLYGPNHAVMTSAYLALPVALVCLLPLLVPSNAIARAIGRRWKTWVSSWMLIATGLAAFLLIAPNVLRIPSRSSAVNLVVVGVCLIATLGVSLRELRLFAISERPANLMAAQALVYLALTSLVWLGDGPFSIGFWFVHALDITGVFAGCYAVWKGYRVDGRIADVVAPITARDPLRALELGLAPVVHRFVEALERKDRITRDHVIRVGETAMRVGEQLNLAPRQLRDLGIAAMLHDVGKLQTPSEILNKPGRLDADEFEIMKRHVSDGAEMLANVASLVGATRLVRAHHERIDGNGYPDRLRGDEIPIGARIISVCDAFDAMVHTRQYRVGMGIDKAAAILREHSGSQWDPAVVTALLALAPADESVLVFDGVGRSAASCGCEDALPESVRELLVPVG